MQQLQQISNLCNQIASSASNAQSYMINPYNQQAGIMNYTQQ
jgi:hypothetical protein